MLEKEEGLKDIIGKHMTYTYESGLQPEIYIKNRNTFSYRINGGKVKGRCVIDQKVYINRIADHVFKLSWEEPTGTVVSIAINLAWKKVHGTIFFPHWVTKNPEKTVCYQNEYLKFMQKYRDAGPIYPVKVFDEFADIDFIENLDPNRDDVITCL